MVMPPALEEDFATGAALEEDEGGLTVFSQPSVQQNIGSATISGYSMLEPETVIISFLIVVSFLSIIIVAADE